MPRHVLVAILISGWGSTAQPPLHFELLPANMHVSVFKYNNAIKNYDDNNSDSL